MKAVVMCAGKGERLRPLTETRQKGMIPVAGKPLLHHLVLELKKAGIDELVFVVRERKEDIMNYFSNLDLGMKVNFAEQGEEKGTAVAIAAAEKEIDGKFVVVAGDIVTEASVIKKVIDSHEGCVTMALKKMPDPQRYGVVELSGEKITMIHEKSQKPPSDLANLSVYCMEKTVFEDIKKIQKSERGEYEITSLLVGAKGVVVEDYWSDVSYPWDLFAVTEHLLSNMEANHGEIEGSTIKGKVIMDEGSKIIDSYIEGTVYLGKNTVIGPHAYVRGINSIGADCSIGESSTVKNSILFDKVNAKHLSYIGDSVVGEEVNFGSGTQLANFRFDGGTVSVHTEKGWINSGKRKLGAVIGDNTKFGVLSCTMPGKLIGNNCWVHSGVVVNKNVPSGHIVYVQQQLKFTKGE